MHESFFLVEMIKQIYVLYANLLSSSGIIIVLCIKRISIHLCVHICNYYYMATFIIYCSGIVIVTEIASAGRSMEILTQS